MTNFLYDSNSSEKKKISINIIERKATFFICSHISPHRIHKFCLKPPKRKKMLNVKHESKNENKRKKNNTHFRCTTI